MSGWDLTEYKAEMLTTGPELMLYTVDAVCVHKNGGWAFRVIRLNKTPAAQCFKLLVTELTNKLLTYPCLGNVGGTHQQTLHKPLEKSLPFMILKNHNVCPLPSKRHLQ